MSSYNNIWRVCWQKPISQFLSILRYGHHRIIQKIIFKMIPRSLHIVSFRFRFVYLFQFQIKSTKNDIQNSIQICMSCTKQTTNTRNEIRELKKSLHIKDYFEVMIKSIRNFLIIFFIFQQLQSLISQFDENGLIGFCEQTLHIYIQSKWHSIYL